MKKRRQKNRATSVRTGETPTQERRRQNGGFTVEVIDRDVENRILIQRYRALSESPLDAYCLRNALTGAEYKAGVKFRQAYFRAVLKIKVNDMGEGAKGDVEISALTPIYSEKLLREAYEAISPKQKAVIIAVCGHDEYLGDTYKIQTLHRGLEKLVDLWKLV